LSDLLSQWFVCGHRGKRAQLSSDLVWVEELIIQGLDLGSLRSGNYDKLLTKLGDLSIISANGEGMSFKKVVFSQGDPRYDHH